MNTTRAAKMLFTNPSPDFFQGFEYGRICGDRAGDSVDLDNFTQSNDFDKGFFAGYVYGVAVGLHS